MGQEFATQLAGRGHDLVLVARDRRRLDEVGADLRRRYRIEVEVLPADLADRGQVELVARRLRDTDRPVDLLVNNAGFGSKTGIVRDLAEQERALEVMARAVLVLSSAAAGGMRERGHGGILNVSSVAGFTLMGHYSAVKSWVTVFTEALALELRGSGVLVTALCPGLVRTEFHDRAKMRLPGVPDGAWLQPSDVVRQGLADLDRGRVVSVPSVRYRAAAALLRYLPRSVTRGVSARIAGSRR